MTKTKLILTHDGAVDEFASVALLCSPAFLEQYDIVAVIVINGDTYGVPAYWCTKRILNMCGQPDVPVGLSSARAFNGFPWQYRQFPLILNTLPALPELGSYGNIVSAGAVIDDVLTGNEDTFVLLQLGGLTASAQLFENNWHRIQSMFWMGGVIPNEDGQPVMGNIDGGIVPDAPLYSEWNVFYDPTATESVYGSLNAVGAPIYQFPLNVTNAYPNNADWIRAALNPLAKNHRVIDFLANAYAAVVPQGGASLWDVVTTIGLMNDANTSGGPFFGFSEKSILVGTEYGPDQARLTVLPTGSEIVGYSVNFATPSASVEQVHCYAVNQWKSIPNFPN